MKHILKAVTVAASLAILATPALSATRLKFAHPAPDTDLSHKMALQFAEQVKTGTNGSVVVDVFPNGQLGTDEQMIDGVRSGIISFTLVGLNNFSGMLPASGSFSLPFMFPDRATAYKVLDGAPGQSVAADMEEFGMKSMGFPDNGYRNITNNRGPIRVPADLSGLRMRVNNSKALNDLFQALDANPQQIPVAELYTALETGVVDAQDHPIWVVEAFKFFEVQKYLSLSQHAYSALALVMNLESFESLTADEKTVLVQAAADAVAFQREGNEAAEEKQIEFLISEGMEVNRDVDSAAFQEASKPVWDKFIEDNGSDMIDAIQEASK
ncbi:DctP family TRAP transporter solute-binding subunit [Granulosicoccus antarcticus]|uniref:2,3-diketo-L-gulonate-binding periplasmic protein YiaO n=1 Tax=Granulosicoccus antarcticus IMCC3135 TaxID=1192854 RepID=A0A2Z2NLE2_9GAMM|nr:DctP family TRAP transporter solute-binding subunit [Granulosicoccus antarcticus]ASJ71969.1 2,3-diketo-L-gulonate-binding periplasmic protein YiaO [Granulosicoccus antarcticus IMCC3135]